MEPNPRVLLDEMTTLVDEMTRLAAGDGKPIETGVSR